ncbi:MAG TPA: hypothetical protein VGH22_14880, partial [Candidatus Binatia bacterium]
EIGAELGSKDTARGERVESMSGFSHNIHVPNGYVTVNKNELHWFGGNAHKSPNPPLSKGAGRRTGGFGANDYFHKSLTATRRIQKGTPAHKYFEMRRLGEFAPT